VVSKVAIYNKPYERLQFVHVRLMNMLNVQQVC